MKDTLIKDPFIAKLVAEQEDNPTWLMLRIELSFKRIKEDLAKLVKIYDKG